MQKNFLLYFFINEFTLEYIEWFNNFFHYLNIFTKSLQKENNIFAYLENGYIGNLPTLSTVEQVFLIAQRFCSPIIKGEVPLPSELENLIYTKQTISECVIKAVSEIINFVYSKELNINLALSKAPENLNINTNADNDKG